MNFKFVLISCLFYGAISEKTNRTSLVVGPVTCKNNTDCTHLENATCVDSICRCGNSRFCKEILHMSTTKVGLSCHIDRECNIENAICDPKVKICTCLPGYVSQEDGKKCLTVSQGLGSKCEDNIQCSTKTTSSLCRNNQCVCQSNMHKYNEKCHLTVDLGQNCSSDAECSLIKSAECLRSTCTCIEGFIESPRASRCLKIASDINSPCEDNIQCLVKLGGGSECSKGFCTCRDSYRFKMSLKKCVQEYLLDSVCSDHNVCQALDPLHSRLECVLGICKCRPEFIEVEGECMSSSSLLYVPVTLIVTSVVFNYFAIYILLRIFSS